MASAARARELGPWLDLVAVRGDIVVPFWLQPGEAAVTRGVGEEREEERIPDGRSPRSGCQPKPGQDRRYRDECPRERRAAGEVVKDSTAASRC
jgi:hypothetical protein